MGKGGGGGGVDNKMGGWRGYDFYISAFTGMGLSNG